MAMSFTIEKVVLGPAFCFYRKESSFQVSVRIEILTYQNDPFHTAGYSFHSVASVDGITHAPPFYS